MAASSLLAPASLAGFHKSGRYSGQIHVDPGSGARGRISWTVAHGKITKLRITDQFLCISASGAGVEGTENYRLVAPSSFKITISRQGKFKFKGYVIGGRHLDLQGQLRGARATGTLSAYDKKSSDVTCTSGDALSFSARR